MTRPLRRVSLVLLAIFAVLIANACFVQVVEAKKLRTDPHNGRQLVDRYRRERGPILASDAEIAKSIATKDALRYLRVYPDKELYASVTGYYSQFGSTGIERTYDDILSGEDSRLLVDRLTRLLTGRGSQGGSVSLSLAPAVQKAAAAALGNRKGAVVAIEPSTGRILAMVSSPSYDPNPFASHDGSVVASYSDKLNADPNQPLVNRATSRRYPPGSLFKLVTSAAALSTGHYKPDTVIPSPTKLKLPLTNRYLSNFGGEVCGDGTNTTLIDALRISCNTAFAGLGLTLGESALRKQARALGIGNSFGFDIPLSSSVFPDRLDQPQTALSAIGQYDVALTPLQAAMIVSAIANHGILMKPRLVDALRKSDLTVLSRPRDEQLSVAMSSEVATMLTQMMVAVVQSGTGVAAQIPGVAVAGKTGTAQHASNKPPHVWFGGFAPADNPRVAVAVLIEDGGGSGTEATGGVLAAPVAKAVMQAALALPARPAP